MRFLPIALVASVQLAAAFAPTVAQSATTSGIPAHAHDHPFSTIYTAVHFYDSGSTMRVKGYGRGFEPNLSYISFFYGTGSVSRGSLACLPPTPNNLTIPQMIVGYWLPVGSKTRTLTVVQTGASYAPVSSIATMSVRYDTNPTQAITPATLTPGRFYLNSCARVRVGTETFEADER